VIIEFLDATLDSLQFGYRFGMIRVRNGFRKRVRSWTIMLEKLQNKLTGFNMEITA